MKPEPVRYEARSSIVGTLTPQLLPDHQIVDALRQQLSWTHLRELITLDDPLRTVPKR